MVAPIRPTSGPSRLAGAVSPIAPPRTMAGWFALIYAIGVVYGTLYPWTGWRRVGLSGLDFLTQPWPRYWTFFDLVTNIGLYAPFGALIGWWTRHRFGPRAVVALSIAAAALLATPLEALQTFLPGRFPSNIDLLCNVAGAAIGAGFALALWPTRLRDQPLRFRPHAKVTIVLLIVWLAVQALPQRGPFETGRLLGPLLGWLDRLRTGIDAPADSLSVVLATQPGQALAPLQGSLELLVDHREFIEACAVSVWLACIGLMLANVLTRSTWRPLAIGALLAGGLLIHLASSRWLSTGGGWAYWLSPGAQGGAAMGVLMLSLLTLLRRRHRLLALMALLVAAVASTNLLPVGGYAPPPAAVQPGWRNLFGLLDALALLWPLAALIATAVEWRALRRDPRDRLHVRPLGRPL
ncbi:MAG: VanZ family protein [Burkholderiaceae bacterium]